MREILFRGKRLDSGEWIYGDLVNANEMRTGARRIEIWVPQPDGECDPMNLEYGVVDPDTVGQYTGLHDKDGKGIFEGDIVLFSWDDRRLYSFAIVYESGEFLAKPEKETRKIWAIRISGNAKSFEIIGNIYDNPELFVQE